jgi:hypothetical protein
MFVVAEAGMACVSPSMTKRCGTGGGGEACHQVGSDLRHGWDVYGVR